MYTNERKEAWKAIGIFVMIPILIPFLPVILVIAFCNCFVDFGLFKFFK